MVEDKGTAPKSKVKITVKTVKNYKVDSIEIFYKNKTNLDLLPWFVLFLKVS